MADRLRTRSLMTLAGVYKQRLANRSRRTCEQCGEPQTREFKVGTRWVCTRCATIAYNEDPRHGRAQ